MKFESTWLSGFRADPRFSGILLAFDSGLGELKFKFRLQISFQW